MGELTLDEQNHWVDWITDAEVPEQSKLEWGMLEHNEIEGLLPFEYVYVDNQLRFRYSFAAMQPITAFFQEKQGDFEDCRVLLEGVLKILVRGQEYLLDERGYLLQPEWIFWNRYEKRVAVCYLPGEQNNTTEDLTRLVEFLMKHMEHKNRTAVEMVYGLYDMLKTDGLLAEEALGMVKRFSAEGAPGMIKNFSAEGTFGMTKGLSAERTSGMIKNFSAEGTSGLITGFQAKKPFRASEGQQASSPAPSYSKSITGSNSIVGSNSIPGKAMIHAGYKHEKEGRYFLKWTEDALLGKISKKFPEAIKVLAITGEGEITVGRSQECTHVLPFLQISRKQAILSEENGRLYLTDTASCNGTWLNEIKLSPGEKIECLPGDRVRFANITYCISER